MKFSITDFFSKCDQIRRNPRITVTEEIFNGKHQFLCSDCVKYESEIAEKPISGRVLLHEISLGFFFTGSPPPPPPPTKPPPPPCRAPSVLCSRSWLIFDDYKVLDATFSPACRKYHTCNTCVSKAFPNSRLCSTNFIMFFFLSFKIAKRG